MEWQFSNITPGVYTFGTAPLSDMPSSFTTVPFVHLQKNNEGEPFRNTVTTTGFTISDCGTGPEPVVTVAIIER